MKKEKYLFVKPGSDGSAGEEYSLINPQDFTEYCRLISAGDGTARHHDEFYLRLIQHFVDSVYENKPPDTWVMKTFADAFMKVVHGGRWEDQFPLPWTKTSVPFTRAEFKALGIYLEIVNALKMDPQLKVVAAIKSAATNFYTDYSTARAAYYRYKKHFSKFI
jgi:hypothetical protein